MGKLKLVFTSISTALSGKIFCGNCGGLYGSKVWHSNSKYKRTIWQCNNKFKNEDKCKTPHLSETELQEAFVKIFNELIENREELIAFIEETVLKVCDVSEVERKLCIAKAETNTKLEAVNEYVKLNSRTIIPQNEYAETFNNLMTEYETAQEKQQQFEKEKNETYIRNKKCKDFIEILQQNTILQIFDEEVFNSMVEKISVFEEKMIFEFKDGTEKEYIF